MRFLPTPRAADGNRGPTLNSDKHEGGKDLVTVVYELAKDRPHVFFKTPTANLGSNGAPQHPEKRRAGGHGPTLEDEVAFLLNVEPDVESQGAHSPTEWWNEYGPAVHRWETICGVAAPCPVRRGPRGGIRLNPAFAEWLLGLPAGWVTEVDGVTVNDQISRIGNGVMPLQAFTAFKYLREVAHGVDVSDSRSGDGL